MESQPQNPEFRIFFIILKTFTHDRVRTQDWISLHCCTIQHFFFRYQENGLK